MMYPESSIFRSVLVSSHKEIVTKWEQEKTRFFRLFKPLDDVEYHSTCLTSTCRHTFGEHIHCMIIWMEAAKTFFNAVKNGKDINIRPMDVPMLQWTNDEIDKIRHLSTSQLWGRLEKLDTQTVDIVKRISPNELFTEHNLRWTWLVWTTFGHYDLHSTELEFQREGKIQTGLEKQWIFPEKG